MDKDGFQDEDGAPELDNDGDGIADTADAAPNEPEDKDGFQDGDGAPDLDNDGDGVTDAADQCADKAGPIENRGCLRHSCGYRGSIRPTGQIHLKHLQFVGRWCGQKKRG